jgi:acyl dehydratase
VSVSWRHVVHQGPVLAGIARVGWATFRSRGRTGAAPPTPGPTLMDEVPALPPDLVRDYLLHVGGNPAAWGPHLPPHLFPQWAFPVMSRLLVGLPYDLSRVLNGGSKLEILKPIPAHEPLIVTARLENVDDDGRRAVLHQVVTTGTASAPEALRAHLFAIVPLSRDRSGKKKEAPPTVGLEARDLATWKLGPDAGLQFAILTGDFNPIHWIAAAGKMAGFGGTILHGFATMARTFEGLAAGTLAGDVHAITGMDVRFVKPLRLPHTTQLYLERRPAADAPGAFSVGDHPGSPAFMTGTFTTREHAT